MTVWLVRYGTYEPAEVVAIYSSEAAATAHIEFLRAVFVAGTFGELPRVEAWSVQSEFLGGRLPTEEETSG